MAGQTMAYNPLIRRDIIGAREMRVANNPGIHFLKPVNRYEIIMAEHGYVIASNLGYAEAKQMLKEAKQQYPNSKIVMRAGMRMVSPTKKGLASANPLTAVMDLRTGEIVGEYSLPPEEAVIAAYAYFEKKDKHTWEYKEKYSHLLRRGKKSIGVGDYAALTEEQAQKIASLRKKMRTKTNPTKRCASNPELLLVFGNPATTKNAPPDFSTVKNSPEFQAAVKKYVEFHGVEPKSAKLQWVDADVPLVGVVMGLAPDVTYHVKGQPSEKQTKIPFKHEFEGKVYAVTDAKGKVIYYVPDANKGKNVRVVDWVRG